MNARTFFRLCGELVIVRWTVKFGPSGFIFLIPILAQFEGSPPTLSPIEAVTADIYGARYYKNPRPDLAACLLGLKPEVATVIAAASFSKFCPDPRVKEARQELVDALSGENVLLATMRKGVEKFERN